MVYVLTNYSGRYEHVVVKHQTPTGSVQKLWNSTNQEQDIEG